MQLCSLPGANKVLGQQMRPAWRTFKCWQGTGCSDTHTHCSYTVLCLWTETSAQCTHGWIYLQKHTLKASHTKLHTLRRLTHSISPSEFRVEFDINVPCQDSWLEREASSMTISYLIRMYNWIWMLNDSVSGLNSIISPNQIEVNNHIKVLIIINLDNVRGQRSTGLRIAWISAIRHQCVLITYIKQHCLKQPVQEIRILQQLSLCNSLFSV